MTMTEVLASFLGSKRGSKWHYINRNWPASIFKSKAKNTIQSSNIFRPFRLLRRLNKRHVLNSWHLFNIRQFVPIRCRSHYWSLMIAYWICDPSKILSVLQNAIFFLWGRCCHLSMCLNLMEPICLHHVRVGMRSKSPHSQLIWPMAKPTTAWWQPFKTHSQGHHKQNALTVI